MSHFSKEFLTWLDTNADHIDQESGPIADQLLEKIDIGLDPPLVYRLVLN